MAQDGLVSPMASAGALPAPHPASGDDVGPAGRDPLSWFGRDRPTVLDLLLIAFVTAVAAGLVIALVVPFLQKSPAQTPSVGATKPPTGASAATVPAFSQESGQIVSSKGAYLIANITRHTLYANAQTAASCQTLAYRVELYNPGPSDVSGVRVAAYINTVTPHRTFVSTIVAYTPASDVPSTAFQAKLHFGTLETQAYVPRTTQLLNSAGRSIASSGSRQLSDGITLGGRGIPIGTVGEGVTEYVAFRTRVSCRRY
jgi:hypothetical protein